MQSGKERFRQCVGLKLQNSVYCKTRGLVRETSQYFRDTSPGKKNVTVQEIRCNAGRGEVFNQHWLALLATKEGNWFKAVEFVDTF